ncbi:MAG: superoxide dismutase [Pseudomonadales bacterium]|nr:superoxide dismutase [Candidatus Woesebacteria bacterium]MCB9801499.1 superoxide dismutase [Pseudomonadales bacterium]
MFTLPTLPYDFSALEPSIDARTMEIHYTKHHQGYTDKLNGAIEGSELADASIEEVLCVVSQHSVAVRNNAGGYYNHTLFWGSMKPGEATQPTGELLEALSATFGSVDGFKQEFSNAAATQFGSGWAWLVMSDGQLQVVATPNQDNPLMDVADIRGIPLLGLDVWEHAYYLQYQNKRPEYIENWWSVVNWDVVADRLAAAS